MSNYQNIKLINKRIWEFVFLFFKIQIIHLTLINFWIIQSYLFILKQFAYNLLIFNFNKINKNKMESGGRIWQRGASKGRAGS